MTRTEKLKAMIGAAKVAGELGYPDVFCRRMEKARDYAKAHDLEAVFNLYAKVKA